MAPRCNTPCFATSPARSSEFSCARTAFGVTSSDADSPTGLYSAVRDFGPVQYRAVAIPHSARDDETMEG